MIPSRSVSKDESGDLAQAEDHRTSRSRQQWPWPVAVVFDASAEELLLAVVVELHEPLSDPLRDAALIRKVSEKARMDCVL
ncbi:MAG: hypothetical protein ACLQHS_11055 [Candidatus Limnocylindrales bacterium]